MGRSQRSYGLGKHQGAPGYSGSCILSWGQAHASCFLTFPGNSAHAARLKHSASYMEAIDEEGLCHASIRATNKRMFMLLAYSFHLQK